MQRFSPARFSLCPLLLALLFGSMPASAQPASVPIRPTAPTPAIAPARPALAPTQQRVAPASPRAAACHNGMSLASFLAELKQQAAASGVSQAAIAAASPYLVYDQGIVNRDPGQRLVGQA